VRTTAVTLAGLRTQRRPLSTLAAPAAAVAGALAVGVLLAANAKAGFALLALVLWVPVALLDLPLAIALWLPLVYLADVPGVSDAMHSASLLVAFAGLGAVAARRSAAAAALGRHARLLGAFLLLVVWLIVSLAWAQHPGAAGKEAIAWLTSLVVVAALLATARSARDVKLILAFFVVAVTVSVGFGLVANALGGYSGADQTLTQESGRLRGGIGDPNYLAIGIVGALPLAIGVAGTAESARLRALLWLTLPLLVAGLAATASRGGILGAAVGFVVALALAGRARRRVLALTVVLVAVLAVWFASSPTAWEHVISRHDPTSGRASLTTVALRVYADHPVLGTGLSNYPIQAPDYVDRPGALQDVNFIAERHLEVHDAYLQVLVEGGIVGLALMLGVICGCLSAGWRARRRFERLGDRRMAGLATAVLVAAASMLTASLFVPDSADVQVWLVLAAGPALLAVANRQAARPKRRTSVPA
jgi:putative inorganic carbon (hco3(-)) transporter